MKISVRYLYVLFLTALVLATAVLWYIEFRTQPETLTVAFLDVGQGDAIFIESPTGTQVLIDGGKGKAVLRELGAVMPFYDRTLDMIIATHPDQDHIGGLPFVLDTYEVANVMRSGVSRDTATFQSFTTHILDEGAEVLEGRRGMVVHLGGGAHLDILYPEDASSDDPNDASIIARLVYKDVSVMLTGDASRVVEHRLALNDGKRLESDILKAGHHGSKTSTANVFLSTINPHAVVISAGKDNRYGHPHPEVIDRIVAFGSELFQTSEGRVVCRTKGVEWRCG